MQLLVEVFIFLTSLPALPPFTFPFSYPGRYKPYCRPPRAGVDTLFL